MLPPKPAPATLEDAMALLGALWEEVVHLRAETRRLQDANAGLVARVQELEARLGQTSSNSSRPPSSDPPDAPPRVPSPPSGRSRGGQPGHAAHQRVLVPVEQVDQVLDHWPATCRHCAAPLVPAAVQPVDEPTRHQVTELPAVRATITEHRLHAVRCAACGAITRAGLPAAVPPGAFGPRLQATVAVLSGGYRLSRRAVAALCADVLGAPLCMGSVDGLCQATATALAEPVAQLQAALRGTAPVHADETSWREPGQRRWLWVVVAPLLTVFAVASSRGSSVIKGLLGETFGGYLISDRWSAYTWVPLERRQVCWAHLKRDFQALVDAGGAAHEIGEEGLALLARLFDAWYSGRDEPAPRPYLATRVAPLQTEFRALLERGQRSGHYRAIGLSESLLKLWPALWTFLTVAGVEPTNNRAEQAIRPAVLWRKNSFGTQSDTGNIFVARLLSVAATCQQQQRSLLAYLTDVCTAAQHGQPIPSLLPGTPMALAA
jgi:transposase